MKIIELLSQSNTTIPVLKTRVNKWLESSLNTFLLTYNALRHQEISVRVLSEYNTLIQALIDAEYLLSNGEKYSSGMLAINGIGDKGVEYVDKHTISIMFRRGTPIEAVIDFSKSLVGLEILSATTLPLEVYTALRYVKKQIQCVERGIPFELTLADMKRILKTKKCYYSGVTLTLEGDHHLTLDRIDASLPYTKENTVACSQLVNNIKNKLLESKEFTKEMSNKDIKTMLTNFCELL